MSDRPTYVAVDELNKKVDEQSARKLLLTFLCDTHDVVDRIRIAFDLDRAEEARRWTALLAKSSHEINAGHIECLSQTVIAAADGGHKTEALQVLKELACAYEGTTNQIYDYLHLARETRLMPDSHHQQGS